VASFTSRSLYPRGRILPLPLDRRLGGLQNPSGRLGEETIFLHRDANLDPSAVQPEARRYTDFTIPATSVLILIPFEVILSCFKSTSSVSFPHDL
jgi:hypothetical protein